MATTSTPTAYADDVFTWSKEQAAALRRMAVTRVNLPEPVDLLNLAEEIESLSISQLRELISRYEVVLVHLLKCRYQPDKRTRSWGNTLMTQRAELERLLRLNPGLRTHREEALQDAYRTARRQAAYQTRLALKMFPETCPFTVEEVESEEFWE